MFLSALLLLLYFTTNTVYGYIYGNAAKGRPSKQSSTVNGLGAANCNDENFTSYCQTEHSEVSWWCMELDRVYELHFMWVGNSVEVGRIMGFEIRLMGEDGSCSEEGVKQSRLCYKDSRYGHKYNYYIRACNRPALFQGKYVFLVIRNGIVNFGEFIVVRNQNPPVNVQSIASSSTSGSLVASNGFDKNINTNFATNSGPFEWWCLELDRIYDIRTFQLYNTVDKSPDITGFELRLALDGACNTETAKRAPTCFNDRDATLYSYFTFVCNKDVVYTARYVFVVQQNKRLRFSEFKIHGRVGSNRVLGEPAQMSSVEGSFSAGYANDGRYSTMSKTKPGSNQWWCVTMKTIYNFTDIKIHNRRDCCKEKMKNFEIRILERGGCSQESLSRAKTCYKEPGTVKDVYHISSCNNGGSFAGQAVFIVNTNSQQLAIRHVEIYGPVFYEVEEVARRKPAFASGYTVGKGPGNGNDGNIKTFVQTNSGNSEWWCVDLFNQHELFRLKIMNGDTQGRRLSGFEVKLHPYWGCDRITYQKSTLCYTHRSAASNEYLIHECDDVKTRFFARSVFIRSTQSYFIEFAEIRILASATHPMYNTALNRPSASSSVANGGVAPRGNDGNQNTQLQTNQEDPAWWCVKLPNVYDFMKLAFYPADSSPDTGIEVKLSNFLGCSAEGLNKANRCHIGTMKGGQVHFVLACNLGGQFRGRYVYVKTVSSGSIQLKEFQALGAIRYPLPNVALNKGTLQSSTDGLTSSLAVDGNPATCSRTLVEDEPWFCVDLDKEYVLDSVGVWRSDLGDYEMRLDQTDFCHHKGFESAKPCYRGSDDVVGKCNQVNSGPFSARSVYITFQKRSLHVCDLIVRPVTGKGSGCTLDWEGLY